MVLAEAWMSQSVTVQYYLCLLRSNSIEFTGAYSHESAVRIAAKVSDSSILYIKIVVINLWNPKYNVDTNLYVYEFVCLQNITFYMLCSTLSFNLFGF